MAMRALQGSAPTRYLDLGCGIGSVLLLTAHRLRPEVAIGVEAQAQSAMMAQATVAKIEYEGQLEVRRADFRDLTPEAFDAPFDLITGSPPYFPVGTGVLPADYQRRACRFELRGGVEDYCHIARPLMSDDGRLVLVFQTEWDGRVLDGAAAAGLYLEQRVDILMRTDRAQPFLSVYSFVTQPAGLSTAAFAIRDTDGSITPEYREARTALGLTTER